MQTDARVSHRQTNGRGTALELVLHTRSWKDVPTDVQERPNWDGRRMGRIGRWSDR